MPTNERANSSGTPDRILASASELFAQYGFSGTGTRDIAASAGVNEVTIYRHFRNKRGLSCAVLEAELRKVHLRGDLLRELAEAADGRTALVRAFQVIRACLTAQPSLVRLLQFSALEFGDEADPLLSKHLGEFVELLAGYLEPWIANGELHDCNSKSLVLSLVFVLMGSLALARVFPDATGDPDRLLGEVANLVATNVGLNRL